MKSKILLIALFSGLTMGAGFL
ncbi:MAG: hypothetical protein H6Q07_2183, partial [Acidobacteria bacterium]|nr:hypothetical protein [Acidobacteriota bacterium]